jgi:glucose-1-phosphatase
MFMQFYHLCKKFFMKNIIFDLGGVILDIDYQLTIDAFKSLGFSNFDEVYSQFKQNQVFDKLEIGVDNPNDFIRKIRELGQLNCSDTEIVNAWNAMLLTLPKERLNLLKKIKNNYNIYLLSNTNHIHYVAYMKYIDETYQLDFNSLFLKPYYSHLIGKRKPNADCFHFVVEQNKLALSETLFIDDTIIHIEGAKQVGLQTFHLKKELQLSDIFNDNGLLTFK